ncbi:hypothetical protein MW374_000748 [Vibrio parahaemolyticus]|uniref:Uncharacterized protein n=1 Tax=Vibrio parahaemolyticus TaxID=670 RepID=A0A9Q3YI05_VIBPH|nr:MULTISPECIES: hypothetical protein [Vibrio]HDM8233733.1 hypothetical protein [Vibrio campbellii]EGQ8546955.1 hypothetical protein [Vibrio parahaemolyticus]EGU0166707.1 hypothetical protein [Vibrio parahaemolyticus]EIO3214633.1 hypothetical protein [Vibrio parahaemolyticus]EJB8417951.1 hypothetical protein [Vibrio vulnificus]
MTGIGKSRPHLTPANSAMEALEKIDDALTKAEDVLSDVLYAEDFEGE